MSSSEIEIEDLLPLPEATFHILMAVADDDRHGYAIIQEVATRTDGALKLSPGTLYRSIQRMLEQGLIEETAERPAPELDDERPPILSHHCLRQNCGKGSGPAPRAISETGSRERVRTGESLMYRLLLLL